MNQEEVQALVASGELFTQAQYAAFKGLSQARISQKIKKLGIQPAWIGGNNAKFYSKSDLDRAIVYQALRNVQEETKDREGLKPVLNESLKPVLNESLKPVLNESLKPLPNPVNYYKTNGKVITDNWQDINKIPIQKRFLLLHSRIQNLLEMGATFSESSAHIGNVSYKFGD